MTSGEQPSERTGTNGEAIPILLTSSIIAHDLGVKLQDSRLRLLHALESIDQWLKINSHFTLVLCDGSNFDLSEPVRERFPNANIECLRFNNDPQKVKELGRGYGEGEIVRFAVEHSETIKSAGAFSKCTSKLWVGNYLKCLNYWNGSLLIKGVFLDAFSPMRKTRLHHIDTRFFIANRDFYQRNFLHAHQSIDVSRGFGLEECFKKIVMEKHIEETFLPIYPHILGMGGGTGRYYSESKIRLWKEKWRTRIASRSPQFKDLFATPAAMAI
jgi:hypothetical protein